ncbi:MAG: tripartite tricarboxylate transporter substrate binding protein [Betaproteobacteria bacterium]|nr:tripartite tricarboxylate transporter substrate binding protein [Betaproteobacteria bacterium]
MKCLLALSTLALAAIAVQTSAHAQPATKWPVRPVRVIVPFPPGGSTDIIARLVTPHLTEEFGQQFIIDNRGGAGGTIGSELLARATPDGYTLAVIPSSYAAAAALYPLSFDPVKGIAPISMIGMGSFIMGINPSVKANNFKEFVDLVKAKPGAFNFASPGTGSTPHLASELLKQMSGMNFVHVPYKGDTPALTDFLGGQMHIMIASGPVFLPHIKSGRARAIAVTANKRYFVVPELPSIAEFYPGFHAWGWNGIIAPAGTPREVINRVNRSIAAFVKRPDILERLRNDGRDVIPTTPEETAQMLSSEIAQWVRVVKVANIKIN